jgi:hypothetical protein
MPAAAAILGGFLLFKAGNRDKATSWFLWMAVIALTVGGLMAYAYLLPLTKVNTTGLFK